MLTIHFDLLQSCVLDVTYPFPENAHAHLDLTHVHVFHSTLQVFHKPILMLHVLI